MRTSLLQQIKSRRKQLGLKGIDMPARTGINRQQYGLIEKSGNPSLETLDKIAEGLEAEIMLIPKELTRLVENILKTGVSYQNHQRYPILKSELAPGPTLNEELGDSDDPWAILEKSKEET
ncbi:helix-turn-helix transcriptional regulator [Pseudomonas nitroreducens]|uniref:helix-turn-helix transcriptional regulator n=2 Tax=Pseudomonas TaxID=286 RepID=UPI001875CB9D|nr:helix-turn-helix transcriptional regulator [Pseudomonas nitritireducens]